MGKSKVIDQIFKLIDRYIDDSKDRNAPVVHYLEPKQLHEEIDINLPIKKGNIDNVISEIEKYLKYSVRTGHPQYSNQLWAGFNLPGFLGDVVAGASNTSMYTYEVAPVATLMEREIISRVCSLIGYGDGDGLFVTGASNANLVAIMNARNRAFPGFKQEGFACLKGAKPVLFISDQAHYSFLKAVNVLGLGTQSVIKVKSDENGRMIPKELECMIRRAKDEGKHPFFAAAVAGTTVLGAFDPIDEIADVLDRHGMWLHVDAALGGGLLFSKRNGRLLKGINRADSVGWNAHKMLSVPLVCSLLLLKQKGLLLKTASAGFEEQEYLFHSKGADYDIGPKSLQCGRRVDVLKLWLAWVYYGEEGFERTVDRLFELAEYAEQRVKSDKRFELLAPRQSVNICFRYLPGNNTDIDSFNVELREKMYRSGKGMVNYAKVGGKTALRFVTLNPDLEFSDIDRFLENIIQTASA